MSDYFPNSFNNHNNEKKIKKFKKLNTLCPKFNQKTHIFNKSPKDYDLKNNSSIFIKIPINIRYRENKIDNNKYIYLDDPYINDMNNQNEKVSLNNTNLYSSTFLIENNYNEELYRKKKSYNRYKNINLKNYNPFNISANDMFDEYIIDYKAGLNRDGFMQKFNQNNYNNLTNQNWKNKGINNNQNQVYNKITVKSDKTNNSNDLYKNSTKINKNNTYDGFYIKKFSKEKKSKNNINVPYRKRIVHDFIYNEFKENNNNISIHSKDKNNIFLHNNNIFDNSNNIKIKKIIKNNSFYANKKKNNTINAINCNMNNKKNTFINLIPKRPTYIISIKNLRLKNELLINKFIEHLSKYSMLYYFKIIKQLFTFLKHYNKFNRIKPKKINTNKSCRIPMPPMETINISSFNYRTTYRRFTDKSNGKPPLEKAANILIDRIKSKNESKSQNQKDECELYRNINELTKKYESISTRKNRSNNLSVKKSINDISFSNESSNLNEFKFSSVDKNKNKEKFENAINKERERKKKIMEKRKSQEKEKENNENISKLIEKNKILKNKIKNLEKNNKKKAAEINWNINAITINTKDKEKNNEKDFSFGDNTQKYKDKEKNKFSYNNKKGTINKKYFIINNKKMNKNEIIKVKNISTKDKRINININYLKYNPTFKNIVQRQIKKKDKTYEICNNFNISLLGNVTLPIKNDKIVDEIVKYCPELTLIKEEDNKIEQSENISQSSFEKND